MSFVTSPTVTTRPYSLPATNSTTSSANPLPSKPLVHVLSFLQLSDMVNLASIHRIMSNLLRNRGAITAAYSEQLLSSHSISNPVRIKSYPEFHFLTAHIDPMIDVRPKLRYMQLSSAENDFEVDAKKLVKAFPNLEILSLQSDKLANQKIKPLTQLTHLRGLQLACKEITSKGLFSLSSLPLTELDINNCQKIRDIKSISSLFPKLQKFTVGHRETFRVLSQLPQSKFALSELILDELSGEYSELLREVRTNFPKLQTLGFTNGNKIIVRHLSYIKGLPLKNLILTGSYITDALLPAIAENFPDLESLDLMRTPITSANVSSLAKLTKLRNLGLPPLALAKKSLEHLTQTLPHLRIYCVFKGYYELGPIGNKLHLTQARVFRRGAGCLDSTVLDS